MASTSAKAQKRRVDSWKPPRAEVRSLAAYMYEQFFLDITGKPREIQDHAKPYYEAMARRALTWVHERDEEDCSHLL